MNPYGDRIQEHYRHPRNYGRLEAADVRHEDVNPFCGDRVRIELALGDGDIVREARFQGDLCMIAKAATSMLTEMIAGSTLDAVAALPDQRMLDALGAEIQPARLNCALLGLRVLRAGIDAWRKSSGRL